MIRRGTGPSGVLFVESHWSQRRTGSARDRERKWSSPAPGCPISGVGAHRSRARETLEVHDDQHDTVSQLPDDSTGGDRVPSLLLPGDTEAHLAKAAPSDPRGPGPEAARVSVTLRNQDARRRRSRSLVRTAQDPSGVRDPGTPLHSDRPPSASSGHRFPQKVAARTIIAHLPGRGLHRPDFGGILPT